MAVLGSNTLNHSADLFIQRAGTTRITINSAGLVFAGSVTAPTFTGELSGNADTATTATTATNCSRQILNGNGMNFTGGALTADRTIILGTPSTITSSSTNSVATSSHNHNIDIDDVLISAGSGGIGVYRLLKNNTSTTVNTGNVVAGSGLRPGGGDNSNLWTSTGTGLSGSWRNQSGRSVGQNAYGIFQRTV